MWQYHYSNLYSSPHAAHYGVLGMRWGVRHDRHRKSEVKVLRKSRNEALSKVTGSDKSKVRAKKRSIKQSYRAAERELAVSTADRLYPLNSHEANRRTILENRGKTFVKSLLMGSYGALGYNQIRASGKGRIKSLIVNKFTTPYGSGSSRSASDEYKRNLAKRERPQRR